MWTFHIALWLNAWRIIFDRLWERVDWQWPVCFIMQTRNMQENMQNKNENMHNMTKNMQDNTQIQVWNMTKNVFESWCAQLASEYAIRYIVTYCSIKLHIAICPGPICPSPVCNRCILFSILIYVLIFMLLHTILHIFAYSAYWNISNMPWCPICNSCILFSILIYILPVCIYMQYPWQDLYAAMHFTTDIMMQNIMVAGDQYDKLSNMVSSPVSILVCLICRGRVTS